jgi:hypothetical protein
VTVTVEEIRKRGRPRRRWRDKFYAILNINLAGIVQRPLGLEKDLIVSQCLRKRSVMYLLLFFEFSRQNLTFDLLLEVQKGFCSVELDR